MKALISGLGSIGRRHGRNLAALGVDVIGFDPVAERRDRFAGEVPGAICCDLLEAALDSRCDFAVIASPNRFHLEQAVACANAGLHLFIEKPLATSIEGLVALEDAVSSGSLIAMMGSNWKFHPGPKRLKAFLETPGFGRVLALQAIGGQYLPDWHPWEDYRVMYSSRRDLGGGVLLDSHELDYLCWFSGPVATVSCHSMASGTLDIDTEDLAVLTLLFANGAMGTVQIDYLQRPYARRVHVTGSAGTALWDFTEGLVRLYDAASKQWSEELTPEGYDLNTMYMEQMTHFIECMNSGAATITPLEHAAHVLAVLDAARRSAEAGGAPEQVS